MPTIERVPAPNSYVRSWADARPAVSVQDLSVSYNNKTAVDGVSFKIPEGSLAGIIGPNGAGKSTLLKAMLGLLRPDRGEVRLLGQPLHKVRKQIAYIPQRSEVDWTFPISVLEVVLLGTYPHLRLFQRPGAKEREWAMACLKRTGMEEVAQRQIGELSGGQQQRVFIARALAQRARLFLLDEPFAGIDAASEETIMAILRELQGEGNTIVAVHHDLLTVERTFTHAVLINRELIASGEVQDVFRPEIIGQAYQANLQLFRDLVAVTG